MSIVVDFAWTKPSVAQMKSWGAVAAGMYVSHDVTKNASPAIVTEYAVAGIKSFLFYEDTADRAALGYPAGLADATFAYATAKTYGKPTWAPVIPACDFDVPDYAPNSTDPMLKLGPVGAYYKAWHDVNTQLGVISDAAYGDFYVIQRLTAAGLCKLGVQTIAWSGGQADLADITLFQNGQMLDSGQVDVEVIESPVLLSHLAWIPGESSPVAAAPKPAPAPAVKVTWAQWPAGAQLRFGSKGTAVEVLQDACRNSGMRGVRGVGVDGDFGYQTLAAVKNFQLAKFGPGPDVDGIAGPKTRAALQVLADLH